MSTMFHQVDRLICSEILKVMDLFSLVFANSTSLTVYINETTAIGTGILNLTITDTDFDTILDFGILSGNTKNAFVFRLLSDNSADSTRTQYQAIGQLYVVGLLSYEVTNNYTLVLFAFDTQNLATITVNVILLPQNTRAPIFNLMPGFSSYQYSVLEGTAVSVLNGPVVSCLTHLQLFICLRAHMCVY